MRFEKGEEAKRKSKEVGNKAKAPHDLGIEIISLLIFPFARLISSVKYFIRAFTLKKKNYISLRNN